MSAPSENDDVIDSRDVIARIEELEAERDGQEYEHTPWAEAYPDDAEELRLLTDLAAEASGYAPDWSDGETLIRDSYFETYAQELAEDCDMIPQDTKWPLTCIDWKQAARELQYDYTSVTFGDTEYWIRS